MSKSQEQFPYFLPGEVALHNRPDDCWLACLGGVYDLTEYVTQNEESTISKYLIAHAGKDVTHFFDTKHNGFVRLKSYIQPATGLRQILLPYSNPIPEGVESKFTLQAERDRVNSAKLTGKCWSDLEHIFNGTKYRLGKLTKKPRPCRITNLLTGKQAIISVCEEDSLERIKERALIFNSHGGSYTWKFEGKLLDMSLTLTENGILDERDRYLACGLPDDSSTYVPNLLCYYNDDLTEL